MKVKDLVENLQKLDSELDALIARDEEGNWLNILEDLELYRCDSNDSYIEEVN